MSYSEKPIEEMYSDLERATRERDAKGPKHPDYEMANLYIESIQRAIAAKSNED